jgi:hypothetical protein
MFSLWQKALVLLAIPLLSAIIVSTNMDIVFSVN